MVLDFNHRWEQFFKLFICFFLEVFNGKLPFKFLNKEEFIGIKTK